MLPPTPLTAWVRSCLRVGPVALARVPMSFRPGHSRPALTGNLTPTPKFGLRKQMWGGNQNPLLSVVGIRSGGGPGFRKLRFLRGLGTRRGAKGLT